MKNTILYILFLIFFSSPFVSFSQVNTEVKTNKTLTIKGFIRESDTYTPLKNANVQVNGGAYTSTSLSGEFKIQAKIGDEIIISHKDFETIYYTIKNDDRITVDVQPVKTYSISSKLKRQNSNVFKSLIDSAMVYKTVSVEKSVDFITESITKSSSASENAKAYEVLADVFMYWKQFDLAIRNYRISLNSLSSNEVKLKLTKAYQFNGNYQESITLFEALETETLSVYQNIERLEGLGDVYIKTNAYTKAIEFYKVALQLAEKHLISSKVTNLNSKIANTYNQSGEISEAENYFNNALNLAEQENKSRALQEKVTVADFKNINANYESEIKLREEAIETIKDIETDTLVDNESSLTIQKQNYKIGTAYYLQADYDNAIPYLEKSIKEADIREDLVVEKDAKRKLTEVYKNKGDFKKAVEAYEDYTKAVEALYIKKEQQITQVARFNKNIAEQQNRITSLEKDRLLTISQFEASSERNKNQKIIIYSLIGGLLLLLLTAYLMYKYIKQQRFANNLLALKSLRSQMNPHFIFNALNSVNSFIALNDERAANKYLSEFSQLMRAVLENSEQDFIPLQKEVELIELYTKLEHFRFQDKFEYEIKIDPNIKIEDYKIPPMLLQPYIENAVWHGLRYKKTKGKLEISIAKKSENEISISIIDDGIGRVQSKALKTENQKKQNSKGMGNIKKRVSILNDMYKDKVDVFIDDFSSEGDTGTRVIVTIKKD